ncbi:MAG: hypothetical protein HFJ53_03195 [Clostridia bacterium]|jgi:hypothetical protein|nr:hypothetical protein [Clostridia bacterium]
MAKSKKNKVQENHKEETNVQGEKIENQEVVEEKTEEQKEKEKLSKDIKNFIADIKDFVTGYEKYHNIMKINPLKETLSQLQKRENLEVDDKKYLAQINRTIYAKTLRSGERMPEHPGTLMFRSLEEKVKRLSEIAESYGELNYITTIDDVTKEEFYCIKEKVVDDKLVIEDALKITNVGGAYLAEAMEEQEINEIKEKYKEEISCDELNVFKKEIKNDPNYALNYYSKICENRKLEAQDKNKELDQIEEEVAEA